MAAKNGSKEEYAKAFDYALTAYNRQIRRLRGWAAGMTERDALSYATQVERSRDLVISLAMKGNAGAAIVRRAVEVVLQSKGLVFVEMFSRAAASRQFVDPRLKQVTDSLRFVQSALADMYIAERRHGSKNHDPDNLTNLLASAERIERDLAHFLQSRDYQSMAKADIIDQIHRTLAPDEVYVTYLRYNHKHCETAESTPHYLACRIGPAGPSQLYDLGTAAEIDRCIQGIRQNIRRVARSGLPATTDKYQEYLRLAQELAKKIWHPLESSLADVSTVFLSLDGDLHFVPFGALPLPHGGFQAEQYTHHYLARPSDLQQITETPEPRIAALALGDPDFDAPPTTRRADEIVGQRLDRPWVVHAAPTVLRSACLDLADFRLPRLPGTRTEVGECVALWEQRGFQPVRMLTDAAASEENFKQLAADFRLLHVATHGFFAEEQCANQSSPTWNDDNLNMVGLNPLLQCGICLAGANVSSSPSDSPYLEDGFLTAQEVAALNLQNVSWVILTACHSGTGQVEPGEGIHGLRKAFLMAGVKTVVSVLWEIPDHSMQAFVRTLYSETDKPIHHRLRRFALHNLEDLRARKQPAHPAHWASFISVGSPSNIH